MPDFFFNLSNYEFPSMGLTRNPSNIFKQTHLLRHGDFWSLSVHEFLNMNLIVSPFPRHQSLFRGFWGFTCARSRAASRQRVAQLCCAVEVFSTRLAIGTIVFEQNLRWRKVQFLFSMRLLRDSDDISCYVCNSGPDMPCILRRTTTWNSLPLPVCIYTIYIYIHTYTRYLILSAEDAGSSIYR